MMSSINEAYAVLSDPSKRELYDQQRSRTQRFDIGTSVLRAAEERLLKQGWVVSENSATHLILEQGTRAVRIVFTRRLDNALMKKTVRQFGGFSVVLAVEIDLPISLSFNAA